MHEVGLRESNPLYLLAIFFPQVSRQMSIVIIWFSVVQWVRCSFPGGKAAGGMKLTTHPNLVSRLRPNGTVPLLLLYAFMALTGTPVTSPFL